MGLIVENARLVGLFGGVSTSKTSGRHFVAIVTPGPKIEKVEVPVLPTLPPGLEFGSRIELVVKDAEQKFSDFNSSFSTARSSVISIIK